MGRLDASVRFSVEESKAVAGCPTQSRLGAEARSLILAVGGDRICGSKVQGDAMASDRDRREEEGRDALLEVGVPHTRWTREGFNFSALVIFILVGAILRDVNLLVVLAGILFAFFLLQWRLGVKNLSWLVMERRVEPRPVARKPFEVRWEVHNPRRWIAASMLELQDRLIPPQKAGEEKPREVSMRLFLPKVVGGGVEPIASQCVCEERGLYRWGPMEIHSRFPLGLLYAKSRKGGIDVLPVRPPLGMVRSGWQRVLAAEQSAGWSTRRATAVQEGDPSGLRDFQPGDPRKWIHWRSSAKRGTLQVRQFQREDSFPAGILIDLCDAGSPASALDETLEFAVTLVKHLVDVGSNGLQVVVADRGQVRHFAVGTGRGFDRFWAYLAEVDRADPEAWRLGWKEFIGRGVSASRIWVISPRSLAQGIPQLQATGSGPPATSDGPLGAQRPAAWIHGSGAVVHSIFQRYMP